MTLSRLNLLISTVFSITTMTQAYTPVPLTSGGSGKTDHPVLFVHGINNSADKSWGYDY